MRRVYSVLSCARESCLYLLERDCGYACSCALSKIGMLLKCRVRQDGVAWRGVTWHGVARRGGSGAARIIIIIVIIIVIIIIIIIVSCSSSSASTHSRQVTHAHKTNTHTHTHAHTERSITTKALTSYHRHEEAEAADNAAH